MKKLFHAAILSLAVCAVWATPSPAWTFGLIVHHGCCGGCCGCGCSVCIRPYNAFTPVVSGCLCCDGCVPFCSTSFNPGYSCGPGVPCAGGCCDGGSCGPGGCDGPAISGALPPVGWLQGSPAPAQPATPSDGTASTYAAAHGGSSYPGYVYGLQPPTGAAAATVPVYWNGK
jgi:hypothetical protein